MIRLWQQLMHWVRKQRTMQQAPPELAPEQFYSLLRSSRAEDVIFALEQHLRTNGSLDKRVNGIKKGEGPGGYWHVIGFCKAHQDMLTFLKRVRRPENTSEEVVMEQPAPTTGGRARWA